LARIFGWRHFDLVEDMVQATLADALQAWRHRGAPENPSAWVYRVARNKILDALRRDATGRRLLDGLRPGRDVRAVEADTPFPDSEMEDSQLRMMFACCHPVLRREDQIAFALKALCGFGAAEIARALLVSEEAVKKRLQRARASLIASNVPLDAPPAGEIGQRLEAVHQVIYLMFNEGWSSSRGEEAIRAGMCEDAVWLCHLLCSDRRFALPPTHALMALLLFHAARLEARIGPDGTPLLLEEQDRGQWDPRLIGRAREYLNLSAEGTVISSYHLEAAIACYHCTAASYSETDWPAILRLYDALVRLQRSPVYLVNRAIVISQIDGPLAGLDSLRQAADDPAVSRYYLFEATLGELHWRAGNTGQARRHFQVARSRTRSPHELVLIERRLARTGV
jgi:RNA polymerase sigma factor (sigma-70 family)